jgi:hypothetical protein
MITAGPGRRGGPGGATRSGERTGGRGARAVRPGNQRPSPRVRVPMKKRLLAALDRLRNALAELDARTSLLPQPEPVRIRK